MSGRRLLWATAPAWRALLETVLLGWVLAAMLVRLAAQMQPYALRNASLICSELCGLWCVLRWRLPDRGGPAAARAAAGGAAGRAHPLRYARRQRAARLSGRLAHQCPAALDQHPLAELDPGHGGGHRRLCGGIMVVQSDWVNWYPWTLPGVASVNYLRHQLQAAPVVLGFVGGILLSFGGVWEVSRRDVL